MYSGIFLFCTFKSIVGSELIFLQYFILWLSFLISFFNSVNTNYVCIHYYKFHLCVLYIINFVQKIRLVNFTRCSYPEFGFERNVGIVYFLIYFNGDCQNTGITYLVYVYKNT